MGENTLGKEMLDKLTYTKKNVYEEASSEKIKLIYDYAEGYKKFLDSSKTEREACETSIEMLKSRGFTEYKLGDVISVGDKRYLNQHGRSLVAFKIGEVERICLECVGIIALRSTLLTP
jgi:aspartyl aminopeptidase